MPRMKKCLLPKKKATFNENFAIPISSFMKDSGAEFRGAYWTPEIVNRSAPQDFNIFYYGHLTGVLTPEVMARCRRDPATHPVGNMLIHVESYLTNSNFKEFLKASNKRYSWDTYYRSILAEQINLNVLARIHAGRSYGLRTVFISTTIAKYSHYVNEWLSRHHLLLAPATECLYKRNYKTKDQSFLESSFWNFANRHDSNKLYFFFDSKRFPHTGWNQIPNTY